MVAQSSEAMKQTPLDALHRELGGRMVPFAGYDMPVQYSGIIAEHNHTRSRAGLFDVSHMGQVRIRGDDPAAALEALLPGDITALGNGAMRYTFFTNDAGGILDDLMVTQMGDHLFLVVNAACKEADIAHLRAGLGDDAVEVLPERALLALQGPAAVEALGRHAPGAAELAFMTGAEMEIAGHACFVSRSGYTGEDGFEISLPVEAAEGFARALLDEEEVMAIGLGARDSLRLEAGLCLYGHDIDETTTPNEAGLLWAISKRRREAGGFSGADVIARQIAEGPRRRRVGLKPEGRAPAREGTEIVDSDGNVVGRVTSGGFGPSVGGPVAMGYVEMEFAGPGTSLGVMIRNSEHPATVVKMPFAPHRYAK